MINKANKPHQKKIQTMALSLLLAIIVWFMVMSLTNPSIKTTVSNLDVRFVGERDLREKNLAITGRSGIGPLSVVVRGNRSDLMNYMDNIYVQIDVSSIDYAGEYNLTGTISVPTTRISVEKENYGDITIAVENVIEKDIDVTVKQTGIQKGKLVESIIEKPTVKITGAESEINKVYGAVATVDISNTIPDRPERVSYLLTDADGALISGNETIESTRSEVEVRNKIYDAKTLPIEPVLSPELDKSFILNTDKTTVSPAAINVGVIEGAELDKLMLVIDKPTGDETEYTLESTDSIYIPPENNTVKVKAQLDPRPPAPAEGNENTE